MIGIPIKKHLKLRYQEEGRTCRTCSDRRKNEGICIKKNRTNDIGGISSFYFYFPFGINDTRWSGLRYAGWGSFSGRVQSCIPWIEVGSTGDRQVLQLAGGCASWRSGGVYTVSYENIRSTRSKNTNYIVFLHCGIYYQCSIWNPFWSDQCSEQRKASWYSGNSYCKCNCLSSTVLVCITDHVRVCNETWLASVLWFWLALDQCSCAVK